MAVDTVSLQIVLNERSLAQDSGEEDTDVHEKLSGEVRHDGEGFRVFLRAFSFGLCLSIPTCPKEKDSLILNSRSASCVYYSYGEEDFS